MKRREFLSTVAAGAAAAALPRRAAQAQAITLNGAVQFNDDHAFTKALVRFEELVKKYYGKPINFTLHKNSALGLEKQYFEYMAQGKAVDYAIVSPAHMSTFSQGRAVHRRAVPLPRPQPLEQGARRGRPEAGRRRDQPEGRGDADRLRRRRRAQHLRQQAGAQPAGDEGPQGPRAGRADLEQDLPGGGHGADGDRLQRGLQRDPERRHPGGRERGGRRRGDEVLRGRAEPQHDRARDHDPAAVLLDQDLQQAAEGSAGRDRQGGQGGRAPTAGRSSRARTRRSSTRWRRQAS